MDTTARATELVAANVRRAVADRQITKAALSEATGIPYSTLKAKMSGRRGPFTATDILALCEALSVDPNELLGGKSLAVAS